MTGTRILRDGNDGPVAPSQVISPEDIQRLGLVAPADMLAQLPSNVGTFELEGVTRFSRPNVIPIVDGKPVGETDSAGAFRVELPGGGTYIITARIESPDSRRYGSRRPVEVETGQALQLSPPIILSVTTYPE